MPNYTKHKKINSDKFWNGRELSGIRKVDNNYATRNAWRRLVLSIYQQAVCDLQGIERVGEENIDNLNHLNVVDADKKNIRDFLEFKTDISKFYSAFIDSFLKL